MAQVFQIDLTALPTHEGRYEVSEFLSKHGFDVNEHWISIDNTHKTIDYIEASWIYPSTPKLPKLPHGVKVTQL